MLSFSLLLVLLSMLPSSGLLGLVSVILPVAAWIDRNDWLVFVNSLLFSLNIRRSLKERWNEPVSIRLSGVDHPDGTRKPHDIAFSRPITIQEVLSRVHG
jgi:hypothetical protein